MNGKVCKFIRKKAKEHGIDPKKLKQYYKTLLKAEKK